MTDDQVTILARRWVTLQQEARAIEAVLLKIGVRIEATNSGVLWYGESNEVPYYVGPPLENA